jgi:L-cysteine:1D-myo-inositol 2-amino-2-deoxy-alpha-D-glucopyranoside ligase
MLAIANERGNRPDDPHKRDPLDFVLWQAAQPGDPTWPSPWGAGRPGWHIECSTLVQEFLGPTVDIHAGGADLIFPHHECEIAQAEAATDQQPFARYWLHTAMVQHEGEKMSKSLGNLVLVRNLLEHYPPDALRLYLANYHYRQSWAYDEAVLKRAASLVAKLQDAVNVVPVRSRTGQRQSLDAKPVERFFWQALEHDLETPRAIAALLQLADRVLQAAAQGKSVDQAQATLRQLAAICGLRLGAEPEEQVAVGWNVHLQRFENGVPHPSAAVQAAPAVPTAA